MLGTNIGKTYKKDYRFSYRHDSIRQFQRAEKVPKVFVLTMKAGSCGITLTAATRVYLMEPCLDPAHEIQAAGRQGRADWLETLSVSSAACILHGSTLTYIAALTLAHASQVESTASDSRKRCS